LNKKRIKEITIIHYRQRRKKSRQSMMTENCPFCGGVELITVTTATELTGISRSVLYDWIAKKKVHSIRLTNGQLRICCDSLHQQITTGDSKISTQLPEQ
jgi:excisionase family DNA binding protein